MMKLGTCPACGLFSIYLCTDDSRNATQKSETHATAIHFNTNNSTERSSLSVPQTKTSYFILALTSGLLLTRSSICLIRLVRR